MSTSRLELLQPRPTPLGSALADFIESMRKPWMRDALCREYPEVDFFPDYTAPQATLNVCERCLVREECLDYAMESERSGYHFGVWGGMPARARKRMANGEPARIRNPRQTTARTRTPAKSLTVPGPPAERVPCANSGCRNLLPADGRKGARFCSVICREANARKRSWNQNRIVVAGVMVCAIEECSVPVPARPGSGRKPIYCSDNCRAEAKRRRSRAS